MDDAFDGGGHQQIDVEFQQQVGVDRVGATEADDGAGGIDVCLQCRDVDAVLVVDGAVLIGDGHDAGAGFGEQDGCVAADLAEALHRCGGVLRGDAQVREGMVGDVNHAA